MENKNQFFRIHLLILMVATLCIGYGYRAIAKGNPPDAFKQQERLGKGGNFGDILYNYNTWDKNAELRQFDMVKEAGFTNLRVCIGPFAHASKQPPYTLSKDFFDRLDWTIDQILKRGIAVIIDQHEYHAMAADPAGKKDMFLSTWKQIAEHYKDYPDNVYFGVLNEPNGKLTSDLWNPLCAQAIKLIRKSNPDRTLVIGGTDWNNIGGLKDLKLPEDDRNIIVEFHYYDPHHFTHQGASWEKGSDQYLGTTWRGTPEEKKAMKEDFDVAVKWGKDHNRPLYLGEFGVIFKADKESKEAWLRNIVSLANENHIAWSIWDLCGSEFGIWDDAANTWDQKMKEAIMPQ